VRTFTKMFLNTLPVPTSRSCYALKSEKNMLSRVRPRPCFIKTPPRERPHINTFSLKLKGFPVPPSGLFFSRSNLRAPRRRRGRRLLREKRGLLNWFITKVAPSGSRFAEAGEASGHSLYAKTQARQESNKHAYMYSIKGHLYRSRTTVFSVIPLLRG
jgi:hypothetical protein